MSVCETIMKKRCLQNNQLNYQNRIDFNACTVYNCQIYVCKDLTLET